MSRKSKGINAERDLVHSFWSNGVPAIRVAGSGSSKYPCPDLLVGNSNQKFAIESKITKETKKYFTKKEIEELKNFSNMYGASPIIAIKFNKSEWFFLKINELDETEKNLVIDIKNAKLKGLLFEEIIKKF